MASGSVPAPPPAAPEATLGCPLVVRVDLSDPAELWGLASWTEPWEVRREEGYAVLGVDAAGLARLEAAGFVVEVDERRTREVCEAARRVKTTVSDGGIPGFECYRTLDEMTARAAELAAARPDLVELVDIGDSWEKTDGRGGFDLVVLRLTNRSFPGTSRPGAPGGKPVLFVQASMHAREYTPAETLTRFAERLVEGHGTDADATWILDEHEVHLLLSANPDGRIRAEQGVYWRKNADDEFCTGTDLRGVDLNRNYEHDWACCDGSSGHPCSEIFRGPAAASEPETTAVQNHLRRVFGDAWDPVPSDGTPGIFLDLHSYGRLVLWPWGARPEATPNGAGLAALGHRLASAPGYTPQQGIDFYPVDGSAMDFAYADRGVASFVIEIGYRFFEPCPVFEGLLVEDMLATLDYAARVVAAPYRTPAGPDVGQLVVAPAAGVVPGDAVEATWLADDRRGAVGGTSQAVVEVEATVDAPPWAAGEVLRVAGRAVDGVLDESSEEVVADIPTGGLAPGRHTVYVRARDADGSWGPVTAAFLDVVVDPRLPRRPSGRVGGP